MLGSPGCGQLVVCVCGELSGLMLMSRHVNYACTVYIGGVL